MKLSVFWTAVCLFAAWTLPAAAQLSDDTVKIGVATDMSSLYADINGPGAVSATQMAIDDFGGTVLGKRIEFVFGDIQNKADVAATLAGRWYSDEKVDMILGAGASSSSIAIENVAGEKKKLFLATDPGSSDITGKFCNPYTVHWTYDTSALANVSGSAIVKGGGKDWFFLTADYAFGYALQRDASAVVTKAGGRILGEVKHPINTSDFSSFLLQAQASKAQVIGLANAGGDTVNSIKQAAEFGIVKGGQKLAALLAFVSDVHSLGLERAQGLRLTEAFYWDLNDKTRAWSAKFQEKAANHAKPSMTQAVVVNGKPYNVQLRPRREYLTSAAGDEPFSLHLIKFNHTSYVGTKTPSDYSSVVRLVDPARKVDREVKIWMNNPLRYAGRTFYQSSFLENDSGTVLQVVKNVGWMVPYVSCMIVAMGLMGHLGNHLLDFLRKRAAA